MPIPPLTKPATMSQRLGFQDPDLTTPEHDAMVFWTKKYVQNKLYELAVSNTNNAFQEAIEEEKRKIAKSRQSVEGFNSSLYKPTLEENINKVTPYESEESDLRKKIWGLESKYYGRFGDMCKETDYRYYKERHNELIDLIEAVRKEDFLFNRNKEADRLDEIISEIGSSKPPIRFTAKDTSRIQLEYAIANPKTNFIIGYADIMVDPRTDVNCKVNFETKSAGYSLNASGKDYYIEVKPRIQSFGELLRQIRTYETLTGRHSWYVACPDTRFKDDLEDEGVKFIQITEDYKDYL